jgi:DNA repair exonuclease SbcCD nuclease subunit
MFIKILATADLHLGRKSSAIKESRDQASTIYTWQRLVDLALETEIDTLVLAGDIVDRDNRFYEAIGPLHSGFHDLEQAGIQVYMVSGNHDHDVLPQLLVGEKHPNVCQLGVGGRWESQEFAKGQDRVLFTGWSFPAQRVQDDPLLFLDPWDPDPSLPNIGLLHCDINARNSNYAPVSVDGLANYPADIWILGHSHKPQTFRDQAPLIFYTGSPHALSPAEPGVHGPVLLELKGKQDVSFSYIPLSPVRYQTLSLEVSPDLDEDAFRTLSIQGLEEAAQNCRSELKAVSDLIFDLRLQGQHQDLTSLEHWGQSLAHDFEHQLPDGTRLVVRKVYNDAQPAIRDLKQLAQEPSPAGKLAETILSIEQGRQTAFLDRLIHNWHTRVQELNHCGTYLQLSRNRRTSLETDDKARQYTLHECNKLLSELLRQRQA